MFTTSTFTLASTLIPTLLLALPSLAAPTRTLSRRDDDDDDDLSSGAKAGIAIGVIVAVALAGTLAWKWRVRVRRRKQKNRRGDRVSCDLCRERKRGK